MGSFQSTVAKASSILHLGLCGSCCRGTWGREAKWQEMMLAQRPWADIKKCFNGAGKASILRAVRFGGDTPAINGRTACVFVTRLVHRRWWRRW